MKYFYIICRQVYNLSAYQISHVYSPSWVRGTLNKILHSSTVYYHEECSRKQYGLHLRCSLVLHFVIIECMNLYKLVTWFRILIATDRQTRTHDEHRDAKICIVYAFLHGKTIITLLILPYCLGVSASCPTVTM
jgi:hypothetical protein